MSRIALDDLPALETLTDEQMAELFGRGLARTRLGVQALETREMMSVSQLVMTGTTLTVYTNNVGTSVQFDHYNGGVAVSEVGTGKWWVRNGVQTVQFIGGAGNDTVRHNMNIRINAWGGAGNDVLVGGTAADQLVGGVGDDRLIGRAGTDALYGGWGNDTLISLDAGAVDYLHGGPNADSFWTDKIGTQQDTAADVLAGDRLNAVTSFANGADRTLNNDRIADPTLNGPTERHTRFANRSLYSSAGPQASDIRQGDIGDCWLLAGLGAIANDSPTTLKQNVVDFGDGTYGVRLGNSFYRVDDDLRTNSSGGLLGAKLGTENSMWVAVVEKAYTHYRKGANPDAPAAVNTYASIDGGWMGEVSTAFGSASIGASDANSANVQSVLSQVWSRWNNYESVTLAFYEWTGSGNSPVVTGHAYTVMGVTKGANGQVDTITIRNPWGVDGTSGSFADANPNDGLITLTVAQLGQFSSTFNWGKV